MLENCFLKCNTVLFSYRGQQANLKQKANLKANCKRKFKKSVTLIVMKKFGM